MATMTLTCQRHGKTLLDPSITASGKLVGFSKCPCCGQSLRQNQLAPNRLLCPNCKRDW